MIDRMVTLLREEGTCVLATCADGKPHCSLMAYVTDPTGRTVYMVTLANSQKFRNITSNPRVSLLVDTRAHHANSGHDAIQALTVQGECTVVSEGPTREEVLARIAAVHPQTAAFCGHAEGRLLAVRVQALLLLDGIANAHFQRLD